MSEDLTKSDFNGLRERVIKVEETLVAHSNQFFGIDRRQSSLEAEMKRNTEVTQSVSDKLDANHDILEGLRWLVGIGTNFKKFIKWCAIVLAPIATVVLTIESLWKGR